VNDIVFIGVSGEKNIDINDSHCEQWRVRCDRESEKAVEEDDDK